MKFVDINTGPVCNWEKMFLSLLVEMNEWKSDLSAP